MKMTLEEESSDVTLATFISLRILWLWVFLVRVPGRHQLVRINSTNKEVAITGKGILPPSSQITTQGPILS